MGAAKGRGSSKSGLSSEDESGQEEVGLNLSSQGNRVDRKGVGLYILVGSHRKIVDRKGSVFTQAVSGRE